MSTKTQYIDTEQRIDAMLQQAFTLRVNDMNKSIQLTRDANDLAAEIGDPRREAQAQSQLGLLLMIESQFHDAIKSSERALQYFEQVKDLKGIADAKYNIAGVHYKTNKFHQGLQFLIDCLYIYRQLGDAYNESRVLKSMGTIYEYFGDQDNAINSYIGSIELAQRIGDLNLESNAYNPLSGIYLKQGKVSLAVATAQQSVDLKLKTNDTRGLAFALYARGKVKLNMGSIDDAREDLNQALMLHIKMGDQLGVAMTYNKLGLLFYQLDKFHEARKYLQQALATSGQYDIQVIQFKAYYNLHLVARAEGNAAEALDYLERYNKIKEGMINAHTFNVIKSYEAISRVKALEREAQSQRERTEIIERKNAELDSFFYRVSHDLKGPISSLLGLHNLITLEVKDEHARQFFDMYQSQIMRINNIVMDLIELTRMNHAEDSKVKINFRRVLDECINAYHYLENFKHIRFIHDIDDSIEFYTEWAIVNTILQNLIENAIKYARVDRDPFVRVSISREDHLVKICVEDNGIGIGSDYQNKVFNMFFRANDHVPGTGLGLYILKRAVERLRGDVSFESHLNEGSAFTVLLPTQ